jgi:hypothetical protein
MLQYILKHSKILNSDMKYGAPMPDPETGIHVPIMAVTMHPQTGAILPIGCTHVDPVTGLPSPVEVGNSKVFLFNYQLSNNLSNIQSNLPMRSPIINRHLY